MITTLAELKDAIEGGDSWVEACECVDVDELRKESPRAAALVQSVLDATEELWTLAGVE